jgi:uncharacterized phage protein gp47/JayE
MSEYVNVPTETDPDVLAQDAFEYLESKAPAWAPNDAQLDTWLIAACARMIALLNDTASDVRTGIFRFFGATVMGLPPIEAKQASSTTTWTLSDTAGHTIPAGTTLAVPNAGGELIPFETTEDVVVPVGENKTAAGGVAIQAIEPGEEGNNLGKAGTICTLEDQYPWVAENGIVLVATTSGGVEEESDEAYLNRLVAEIRLMALAPITAENYAVLARNIGGVYRAVAINLYNPEVSVHTGTTKVGTAIIEGLTEVWIKEHVTVGTEVSGEGIPLGAKVTSLAEAAAGKVTISANAESSKAGINITFTGKLGQEKCVTISVVDANGNALSGGVKAEVLKYLEERREVNYLLFVIDPTYTTIDVEFECTHWSSFEPAAVLTNCSKAVEEFLNAATWGLPPFGDKQIWYSRTVVKINDIIAALGQVQGVKDVNFVKIRRHAVGIYEAKDIELFGVAALTKPGTVGGVVV